MNTWVLSKKPKLYNGNKPIILKRGNQNGWEMFKEMFNILSTQGNAKQKTKQKKLWNYILQLSESV